MPRNGMRPLQPAFSLQDLTATHHETEVRPPKAATDSQTVDRTVPTKIFDFLYLGSVLNVQDKELLEDLDVTHVVTAAKELADDKNFAVSKPGVSQLLLPLRDRHDESIEEHFDEFYEYVESVRKRNGVVLVHCRHGVSRSPSLVISYVMKFLVVPFEEALEFVKNKRPGISINLGFRGCLDDYSASITYPPGAHPMNANDTEAEESECESIEQPPEVTFGDEPSAATADECPQSQPPSSLDAAPSS